MHRCQAFQEENPEMQGRPMENQASVNRKESLRHQCRNRIKKPLLVFNSYGRTPHSETYRYPYDRTLVQRPVDKHRFQNQVPTLPPAPHPISPADFVKSLPVRPLEAHRAASSERLPSTRCAIMSPSTYATPRHQSSG